MFPAGYNNAYQIIQTPGCVTIVAEMIHEARVIPIDGRPHLDDRVRQWTGENGVSNNLFRRSSQTTKIDQMSSHFSSGRRRVRVTLAR